MIISNDKVFISYLFTNGRGHGFGNCWIQADFPIDSIEIIRKAERFIKDIKPEHESVTILNWRRFEESDAKAASNS